MICVDVLVLHLRGSSRGIKGNLGVVVFPQDCWNPVGNSQLSPDFFTFVFAFLSCHSLLCASKLSNCCRTVLVPEGIPKQLVRESIRT